MQKQYGADQAVRNFIVANAAVNQSKSYSTYNSNYTLTDNYNNRINVQGKTDVTTTDRSKSNDLLLNYSQVSRENYKEFGAVMKQLADKLLILPETLSPEIEGDECYASGRIYLKPYSGKTMNIQVKLAGDTHNFVFKD